MSAATPGGETGGSGAPFPQNDPDPPELLPVRMLNEFAYCPCLFHLMHVEGRWADNVYTIEGRSTHRRVDQFDHLLPDACGAAVAVAPADDAPATEPVGDPEHARVDDLAAAGGKCATSRRRRPSAAENGVGDEPPVVTRSVPLDSPRLGLTAKLDLVATAPNNDSGGYDAVPVETKRGRAPATPERCYEPERVQLMAQGLLLREHGYRCDHGVLYFAGSRTRVDVPFTPELEARTLALIQQAREATARRDLPPPLDDSPKCGGCSLNGICLPDETLALLQTPPDAAAHVRRLYPAHDDALPLYVQEPGAVVGKSGEVLIIRKAGEELGRARLKDVSQLVLCGNVSATAQTVHLLCESAIPIVHLSMGAWFYGVTHGINLRNAYDRAAQFAAANQPERCLAFARDLVSAKGLNQRTMLRRNASPPGEALADMRDLTDRALRAGSLDSLLGLEGNLAAHYFRYFAEMLRPRDFDAQWDFTSRNRRPPRDPVNAMLSFGYALLTKEFTAALLADGLDPWWGLYHQPRHGRPALALDLMEPFRPLIVDSAVVTAVNTGMVRRSDFTFSASACMLKPSGRKALIRSYEARLDQLVTHPVFDYQCAWRAMIRLHTRLFSRWLRGDVPRYSSITTR